MKTVKYYLKIYILMVSQYAKSRLQYRQDFFISIFAIILSNLAGLVSLWVLFNAVNTLSGWDFYQITFMYGFCVLSIAPFQIFFANTWNLRVYLYEGSFIKYYFRPLNIMFYFMSEILDVKAISQAFIGGIIIFYSAFQLNIYWTINKVLLLFLSLFGSSLIMISLMILSASCAFWFSNSIALVNFTYRLRDFAKYPISIFNKPIKIIFTFVLPIGFISYYPSLIFLSQGEGTTLFWVTPVVGIVFFIFSYWFWSTGVRNYTGTGT